MRTFLTRPRTPNRRLSLIAAVVAVAVWQSAHLTFGQSQNVLSFGQGPTATGQAIAPRQAPVAGQTQQAPDPASFAANAKRFGVAVVDISYVFKQHLRFKAAMDQMKLEMEGIEKELKADKDAITQLEAQRNEVKADSQDFRAKDEELARKMADFNIKMNRLRKDFLDREARIYYQTYLEIVDAVRVYATRIEVGLVIRFNDEPIDGTQREAILRDINKPVVFQNQIDITPMVIDMLNSRGAAVTNRPGPPGSMIPQQR